MDLSSSADNTYTADYDDDLSHVDNQKTVVVIGGASVKDKFIPNINASRWQGEAWMNINHRDTLITTEKETVAGGVISIESGDITHRYYTKADNELEYEMVYASNPPDTKTELDFKLSSGLTAFYQPSIDEEIASGAHTAKGLTEAQYRAKYFRPENVEQSYAIYLDKKHNQYRSGKFCHLYYPYFIQGAKKVRAKSFTLDIANEKMVIEWPDGLIATAINPVILDPTLGYTSIGGSWFDFYDDGNACALAVTSAAGGGDDVTHHAYLRNTFDPPGTVDSALYDDSGGSPDSRLTAAASNSSVSSAAWYTINVPDYSMSGSTDYWIGAVVASGAVEMAYDATGGSVSCEWDASGSLPATWSEDDTNTDSLSLYLTYTAASSRVPDLMPVM